MPVWTCKPHAELTLAELYAILRLRSEVFVVEQNCVFLDMDDKDLLGQTEHL
ncbi:GNAT family N-acetyltransferase, partial [Salmonella enterica]|nr:GNAT family N-acetyltransferase [Salmonella enterica]